VLSPAQIIERLEAIEQDLGERQLEYEQTAEQWTRDKREQAKAWATAYMESPGAQVTDRKAAAIQASEHIGEDSEARYVALKAAVGVLETRATIGQSLLKAHGRVS
jgi:hypothetical protein